MIVHFAFLYGWIRERARWSKYCVLMSYPSEQETVPRDFPHWSSKHRFSSFGPYIVNPPLTRHEVKMAAGYNCPLFCFAFFFFFFFSFLWLSHLQTGRGKNIVSMYLLSCSLTDASSSEPTVISTAVPTASPTSTKQPSQQGRYFSVSLLRLILALSAFFFCLFTLTSSWSINSPPHPHPQPPKKYHYRAVMTSH